ncbi:MAG: type III pantothenate kinase [Gammaproteobacteria bacterium]|nr:type III pantothenate kinase [Gammaproteobacteria bacterium]MDD9897179.1 type III pantothenate kinase [Gammaproteobacteria bacterium]MDD9959216.1 type III pantothenate kinase [Gammaproteobacteria bacterium]
MILELDIGNSRIKWRHKSLLNGDVLAEGVFTDELEFIAASSQSEKPEIFRYSSVGDPELAEKIVAWSRESWNLEPLAAEVSRHCDGLTINYPDISRLGVDRWLAMLAGFHRARGACLIIDSGTAFTLDAIAADGNHLGGFILPGLALMQQSLFANTAIRLSSEAKFNSTSLGNSTEEAIFNGSAAGLVALVEKEMARLSALEGESQLIFTGGDAQILKDLCEVEQAEIVPGLVLDGLAIACPNHRQATQ